MKKWLWCLGIIAAIAALSVNSSAGQDIGKLQPVQTVCLTRQNGVVILRTDTGDAGAGETLTAAVENMRSAAVGEIFLETADYLLLAPGCQDLLPEAMDLLRPSCGLCLMEGEPDMEKLGQFLQLHAPDATLMRYRTGLCSLQTLKTEDGRMTLAA